MSNNPVDKNRHHESIVKLYEIYKGISQTVDSNSKWRCPYKNVKDECTADFGCRNQKRVDQQSDVLVCTGSDNLNYRDAGET